MIWQRARTSKNQVYADIDGVGRYLIRWITGNQEYRAYLNGKRTTYAAKTVGDVQKMVERVNEALDQFEREQAVTVSFAETVDEHLDDAVPMVTVNVTDLEPGTGNRRHAPEDMEEYADAIYAQAQHYAVNKRYIVLTDIYLALESCARKCVELERRVRELEKDNHDDGQT